MDKQDLLEMETLIDNSMSICFKLQECLNNPDTPLHVKQVYFMDHEAEIRKALTTLSETIAKIEKSPIEVKIGMSNNFLDMLNEAKCMLNDTRISIGDFKASLTVNKDVTEEDLKVAVTEESIKANETTIRHITNKLQPSTGFAACNYVVTCGEKLKVFYAFYANEDDKNDVNMHLAKCMQEIYSDPNYDSCDDIRLFKISPQEVALKKQVTYTI